uniref:Isopentenyl phosphate kinase n=1 Tax=Tetradesmus obliquus TaxID=3088 RepID=A0A383VWQ2_TETOB|eukprot:jgi/Sobl393_1/6919/SZX69340.1
MQQMPKMHHSTSVAPPTATPIPCHCIIKLGGSAITNKHKFETLKEEVLRQVCSSIKQHHSTAPGGIVLVHGAGSFGHFQASQYGVARGGHDPAAAVQGFVETRRSVTQLNHAVVSALVDAGVPAVGLSPCGTWSCSGRQLQDASPGIAAVQAALQHGLVPVLHGDCVFDATLGVTILSGDAILRALAAALRPAYCVFLADVAGLLTQPPEQPGARLIPAVEVAADGSWSVAAAAAAAGQEAGGSSAAGNDSSSSSNTGTAVQLTAASHDTTGGIAAKVAEAAGVVLGGCPVVIAQAGTASGAAAVLHGPNAFAPSSGGSSGAAAAAGGEVLQGTVIRLAAAAAAAAAGKGSNQANV